MKWISPYKKEPAPNDEYHVRNAGDKFTLWWDHKEKEFYFIEQSCAMTYFPKEQYPNIEWLDESEPEPLYTDKDLILFAEFCENIWTKELFEMGPCTPAKELLKPYLNTRIPATI
jgi:hypothetical protein